MPAQKIREHLMLDDAGFVNEPNDSAGAAVK
jgi:hypothetical protein